MKIPLFLKIVVTNGEERSENGLIYTQSCGTKEKFINKILVNSRGEVMQIATIS